MPREPDGKAPHTWREIAEQMMLEQDPVNLAVLVKKLNQAMPAEEKEKVRRRLGIKTDPKPDAA